MQVLWNLGKMHFKHDVVCADSGQQHRHCYGYIIGVIDPPEQHVCYRCLLTAEGPRYAALQSIAEVRHVLWALYDGDARTSSQLLGKRLGLHTAYLTI